MKRWLAAAAATFVLATPTVASPQPATRALPDPHRYDADIAAFETQDRASPPGPCRIVFVGSSTIRRWTTLEADMAPLAVLNRGFGGSHIADVTFFFDRVVAPYRPRAIVFYAGENDFDADRPATDVVADFARFMDLKTRTLGDTPVYFVSLKPSRLREPEMGGQAWINARIRDMSQARSDLHYIDIVPAMLLPNGHPRNIFVEDGLHMTPAGYAIWTPIIRGILTRDRPHSATCPAP